MGKSPRVVGVSGKRAVMVALGVGALVAVLLVPPVGAAGASSPSVGMAGAPAPNPYRTGMNASLVLGQLGFGTRANATGPANQSLPTGAAFDASGNLWVVDQRNNRVLQYRPPFHSGMNASIAIGQPSLTSSSPAVTQTGLSEPTAAAFAPDGDLWVADYANSRLLGYAPPFKTGMNASLVIGQTSFTTLTSATTANGLRGPTGLAFTATGSMFAADLYNNRVLEYSPPLRTGMNASLVLGQVSFTGGAPGTTSSSLDWPYDVAVAPNGNLFVADELNNRTVMFAPSFTTGMAASLVLGQSGFTSSTGGSGATSVAYPSGVAVDAQGDVWVNDYYGNRTVEYRPPLSDGMSISVALGQPSTTATRGGIGAAAQLFPLGVAVDARGDVWVSDSWNNRTLEYAPPSYTLGFEEAGLPAGARWTVSLEGASGTTTSPQLNFTVMNGTFSFTASAGSGYVAQPATASISVNGTSVTAFVQFSPTIAGIPPSEFAVAVVEGAVAIALATTFVLLWRRLRPPRPARTPPAAYGGPTPPEAGPPGAPP